MKTHRERDAPSDTVESRTLLPASAEDLWREVYSAAVLAGRDTPETIADQAVRHHEARFGPLRPRHTVVTIRQIGKTPRGLPIWKVLVTIPDDGEQYGAWLPEQLGDAMDGLPKEPGTGFTSGKWIVRSHGIPGEPEFSWVLPWGRVEP